MFCINGVVFKALVVGCLAAVGSMVLLRTSPAEASSLPNAGYWEVAADGGIFSFGNSQFYGSMGGRPLNRPVVGMASTPDGHGYWEVASDGGIFAFGDAGFYGSTGSITLHKPIVGMAANPDGGGYWMVASDGGVFAFGTAPFYGSLGGTPLVSPVTSMTVDSTGAGYWLVTADGSVYPFGDAGSGGSTTSPSAPIVAIQASLDDAGYWRFGSNGSVYASRFAQSDGQFSGELNAPVVGAVTTLDTGGYWEVAADGGIFSFGDAPFLGSMGGHPLNRPIVGIATPKVALTTLAYGPSPIQNVHISASARPGSPVVVLVHGGGWAGGSQWDLGVPQEAAFLTAHGATVYNVGYRLATPGQGAFPMEVDDVVAATRLAMATAGQFNGNPADISLFGGSSGGNIVELAAEQVPVVHVVSLSGISDLNTFVTWLANTPSQGLLAGQTEAALQCSPISACATSPDGAPGSPDSPVTHPASGPDYFISSCTDDPVVPISQDQEEATVLGSRAEYLPVDCGSLALHAFEMEGAVNPQILSFLGLS